ncbi:hypothetical protein EDB81DRAFT_492279 [Dactylonectria macrodidyma]|uniref:Uncharacterized protein n=1 Tax=Dactylonectria macrodidyma TaxID=307937 RepID=A0A9P9EW84_9HYPO|nr:hypothetical protein EDB81DRAFT_492279 [Dactylonectria macrodidyma]
MPPMIIADSDDEDHDYSPPHRPQEPLSRAFDAEKAHSFGGVSHATLSTDLSFFQNIYDEQNEAARGNAADGFLGSADNHALTSSEVTAPAPFQRKVTALIEPSSLTSISDPTATREPNMSSGKETNEFTQVSTPGRKKAPTAMMDALWDVPSSPETGHARQVFRFKLNYQNDEPGPKSTEKPVIKLKQRGTLSVKKTKVHHGREAYGGDDAPRSAKRRRIESSHLSPQNSNEVDLVAMPFSYEGEDVRHKSQLAAPSSILPPTLPIGNEASFYISAKTLTSAQKLKYQSVSVASSDNHHQEDLPPINQNIAQLIGSSGSATNVNTPRSDGIGFSTAPLPSIPSDDDRHISTELANARLPSSPDIISMIEPPVKQKDTKKRGRPKKESTKQESPKQESPRQESQRQESQRQESPKQETSKQETSKHRSPKWDGSEISSRDDVEAIRKLDEAEPTIVKSSRNDEESDYEEPLVKAKKSRGRPRKKATEEATLPTAPLATKSEVQEDTATQKKKRGRPRKQDKPIVAEQSPKDETGPSDIVEPVPPVPAHSKIDSKASRKKQDASRGQDELQHEDLAKSEPDTTVLKGTSQNAAAPSTLQTDEKSEKCETSDSSAVEESAKPSPLGPVTKGTGQARGLSAITATNKPLYRVGLSKRSRIAPLLKSLRK